VKRHSFKKIIERVKDIISLEVGNQRVTDKMVAIRLKMTQETLAANKKRDRIPNEELACFCAQRKICINWMLFDQQPKELEETTLKHAISPQ